MTKSLPVRLRVAGRGSCAERWKNLARDLGVADRVEFLGQVPYAQMPNLYRSADAFIFTSLRDSFGSQVLEAMASGLPVIGLNHQGVRAIMPAEAGIKVEVTSPERTVAGLGEAMMRLAASPDERMRMAGAAWEFARRQTWSRRAAEMCQLYRKILEPAAPPDHGASQRPLVRVGAVG